jgi:DNA-binding NarL/FixJ family response regulator
MPRARELPERPRVAIDAQSAAQRQLMDRLGERVRVVPLEAADVLLREAAPSAPIVADFAVPTLLLVDQPDAAFVRAALAAGAAGVLARSAHPDEVLSAVEAVRAGLLVIDPAAREAFEPAAVRGRTAEIGDLTERERQVLAMLAAGISNRRIAQRLSIAENTVKAHVAAIFGKLGATTRTEAVTIALRRGLVML